MLRVKRGKTVPAVLILRPERLGDDRGFFSETYNRRALAEHGFDAEFVQDNHSLSRERFVLRGLHFQTPPFAQDKLVRVVSGRILDVAVDLRRGSPTYGRHEAVELSATGGDQLLVPIGFAHGVLTLEPNTEILYKVSNYYSPPHDLGIHWADPSLGIDWPLAGASPVLSAKDRTQPTWAEIAPDLPFVYGSEPSRESAPR